jgi:hypothetical protein
MHKEELIELHELMEDITEYFESSEDAELEELFPEYSELEVGPRDIHQSKSEHKHAIFVLGQEVAEQMADDEFSERGRIGERMKELADKNAGD